MTQVAIELTFPFPSLVEHLFGISVTQTVESLPPPLLLYTDSQGTNRPVCLLTALVLSCLFPPKNNNILIFASTLTVLMDGFEETDRP